VPTPNALSPLDRFLAGFVRGADDECWLWRGEPSAKGYGRLRIGGRRQVYVHRFALELRLGRPLRDDEDALHSCDTPLCVNYVSHLRSGDQATNVADAVERDRLRKERCRRGHERTPENTRTRIDRRGYVERHCRDCERLR